MDTKAHLKTLCELHGPSGYETPVREALAEVWRPLVDRFEVGRLGSLVGIRDGGGPQPRRRVMLSAHIDEIGMVVNKIEGPFLRFTRLSGVDQRVIVGRAVIVHGRTPLKGVVGYWPRYALRPNQTGRFASFDELLIDTGLGEKALAEQVRVGDVITMDAPMIDLQGSVVAGKAVDNRACVAAVTACLDYLQSRRHQWDVYAVASVQEEVGGHGARAEAFRLRPDIAIALDVTFATQPGVSGPTFKLGEGVPISLGANFHPALYEAIQAAAGRLEMTLQPEPTPAASGTDAWPIQVSRDGIPTALLNIPIRNMHSTVETVDTRDIERAGRLLAEFITGLDAEFLATIVWDKKKS